MRLQASYVLPLRCDRPRADLSDYLGRLGEHLEVLVVDGSPPEVFRTHQQTWPSTVRHLPVDPDLCFHNGKVNGVLTGLRHASHDRVVIADEDVRYDLPNLDELVGMLGDADLVVPQNYFDPRPWHARWDTARTVLNRAVSHDYPGTLALRRDVLPHGYDGDVLFENLELIRTVRAAGGRVRHRPDLYVRRVPCGTAHFVCQRVRQAYDSLAQPKRLAIELALLPGAAGAFRRHGWPGLGALGAVALALAERGRRRAGGHAVFPATTLLFVPAWLLERGVFAWVAVWLRLTANGVPYAGARLVRSATPQRTLRRRLASQVDAPGRPADGARPAPRRPSRWDVPASLDSDHPEWAARRDDQRPVLAAEARAGRLQDTEQGHRVAVPPGRHDTSTTDECVTLPHP